MCRAFKISWQFTHFIISFCRGPVKWGNNKYLFSSWNRSTERMFSKVASLFPAVERQTCGGCLAPVAALQVELSAVPTLPYPVLAPSLCKSLMYGFSATTKSYKQPSTQRRQLMLHFLNTILKSCCCFFLGIDNVSLPWFMLFKHADLHSFPVVMFSKLKKCADWCEVLSDNSSM